jgi:ABC-type Fe3+-hydroxamate transport system substrate-binding protein
VVGYFLAIRKMGLRKKGVTAAKSIVVLLALVILATSLFLTAGTSCTHKANPSADYPLTITDLLGRDVQVPQRPVCIVTTHPTATETLYRVGGVAVGRDTASQYPVDVLDLPTVGSPYSISTELIAELNPDLIIIEALTQANLIDPLEQLGIPVIAVRATSLEDIRQSLTMVGEIINTNETATQALAEIEDRIEAAQSTLPSNKSILIFIADSQNNIYAAKPESYPGTVASLLGLGNLATGLPDSGPYPGFALFTAEQASQSDPDVVFTITPAPPPAPRLSTLLPNMPGFNLMSAVNGGHVVELDPVLFLQAPGPRIADAVEELLSIVNNL